MIINRLRVRGKLNLLLLLPVVAVVLIAVPFVSSQIGNAASAVTTADAANNARQLGALVWDLQRERLITAGYLAAPGADPVRLRLAQQTTSDTVVRLRDGLGATASDEMVEALARVGSLNEIRQGALMRGASVDSVARTYHAVIEAIIDALRLVPQRTSDAEGTRQLTALDALLQANEENELRGMALIAAAVSPGTGVALLDNATEQAAMFTERFVEQADAEQAGLVVLVDQGETARQVDDLAEHLPAATDRPAVGRFVAAALSSVSAQSDLRRMVQDRVTRQIADTAAARADAATGLAWAVGLGTAALVAVAVGLLVAETRSIATPLRRLTTAAATVADLAQAELVRVNDAEEADEQPPAAIPIDVTSGDELGDLATAFNRVQAAAAQLVERQIVTRRNVSAMFTNVAQRTRNLVGQQLDVVDQLERNEQDPKLLGRLYRLDHLSTRLRRNAENLLVVAGTSTDARVMGPTPLATLLRVALAEIEEFQRVRFTELDDVTVAAGPASDLVLVFAELLENAAVFSPPESVVEVSARLVTDGRCQVSIADRGIGMTAARMAQENRRLVERERLDIAPTSVLGLFVVGRLAKRHGLAVTLTATEGGGTTAHVTLPPALFQVGPGVGVERSAPRAMSAMAAVPVARGGARDFPAVTRKAGGDRTFVVSVPVGAGGFAWFGPPSRVTGGGTVRASAVADTPGAPVNGTSRPGLSRRVPGAQLPGAAGRSRGTAAAIPPQAPPVHDAAAVRDQLDAFQSTSPPAPPQTGPGPTGTGSRRLARRVPGANLAPGLRAGTAGAPAPAVGRPPVAGPRLRDPDAVRDAFDSYSAGVALGQGHAATEPPSTDSESHLWRENHA
ncbi:nitrate- and nitrite sensing domain-containing protein [Luedemannella flava]|uniref:histidine kinase n=1 Tax=Luedemannella flava TaxID=349316 RepID=A0ABP4YX07_9ACTN